MNEKNLTHPNNAQKRYCFIHRILQRSGTNYLYRLLREHPDIAGPGPIWEDFFLHHSNILKDYFNAVKSQWQAIWEIEKKIGKAEILERYLGNGIKELLDYQLCFYEERIDPKIVITKTPSVQNIEHFFDYFHEDYLMVIVTDGRSSGGIRRADFWLEL